MKYPKIIFLFFLSISFLVSGCEQAPQQADDGGFEGRTEWNPGQFSPLPNSAPFDVGLQIKKDTLEGQPMLHLQFLIQNPTSDSVFVTTRASNGILFDFTVTTPDSIRIWSKIQSNVAGIAKAKITLEPGETKRYSHNWDYTNYSGAYIGKGQYLVYGTIAPLTTVDRSFDDKIKEYEAPIVGPDTLELSK